MSNETQSEGCNKFCQFLFPFCRLAAAESQDLGWTRAWFIILWLNFDDGKH